MKGLSLLSSHALSPFNQARRISELYGEPESVIVNLGMEKWWLLSRAIPRIDLLCAGTWELKSQGFGVVLTLEAWRNPEILPEGGPMARMIKLPVLGGPWRPAGKLVGR